MRKFRITIEDETYEVVAEKIRKAKETSSGETLSTTRVPSVRITIEDETYEVAVEELKEARRISSMGSTSSAAPAASLARAVVSPKGRAPVAPGAVCASSPCTVVSIKVSVGSEVAAGDTLLITESMKMQTSVSAKTAGIVKEIHVEEGQFAKRGAPLVTIE